MSNEDIIEVLNAYCCGFFPMADANSGEISWYSPDLRAVFPLYQLKPTKSLIKFIEKHKICCSINKNFDAVIRMCSNRETTWISDEIIELYSTLHVIGFAHSVETWIDNELVGGLYGIAIGAAFFGESMFNTTSNAAKVAFYHLVEHLKNKNFLLLDSQFINNFTQQLGAIEIPREEYLKLLEIAISKERKF